MRLFQTACLRCLSLYYDYTCFRCIWIKIEDILFSVLWSEDLKTKICAMFVKMGSDIFLQAYKTVVILVQHTFQWRVLGSEGKNKQLRERKDGGKEGIK